MKVAAVVAVALAVLVVTTVTRIFGIFQGAVIFTAPFFFGFRSLDHLRAVVEVNRYGGDQFVDHHLGALFI